MPDARFKLHDVFAATDRVVTRWSSTGTLTGVALPGRGTAHHRFDPPTNRATASIA
ncbi:nuclear transport factor 2 family protein [Bosea sp. (in: a-proteobacteria)]|uniref:nuclear transport factor 2 family protein n=1 Tax=Bosea sp. (in: a-proteobacteria) TaxID=1871050 RepID=UPI00403419F6